MKICKGKWLQGHYYGIRFGASLIELRAVSASKGEDKPVSKRALVDFANATTRGRASKRAGWFVGVEDEVFPVVGWEF